MHRRKGTAVWAHCGQATSSLASERGAGRGLGTTCSIAPDWNSLPPHSRSIASWSDPLGMAKRALALRSATAPSSLASEHGADRSLGTTCSTAPV